MTAQHEIELLESAITSHRNEINEVNLWLDNNQPPPLIEYWLLAQMDYRESQIVKLQECINAQRRQ